MPGPSAVLGGRDVRMRGRIISVFRSAFVEIVSLRFSRLSRWIVKANEVRLKHFDAHLVYPGGPSVPLDRLECLSHELGRNSPCQRVYLDLLHDEPFTRCHHGVQTVELLGDVS